MGAREGLPINRQQIENAYPRLQGTSFEQTSPPTEKYNCVAWAAKDETRTWWPWSSYYWPSNIPRVETVLAFTQAFATLGYQPCEHGELEERYEKVAIYVDEMMTPTHMARQLDNGQWTSKLGDWDDITHDLDGLTGPANELGVPYGQVVRYLKRAR